jgi:hypothetical protein
MSFWLSLSRRLALAALMALALFSDPVPSAVLAASGASEGPRSDTVARAGTGSVGAQASVGVQKKLKLHKGDSAKPFGKAGPFKVKLNSGDFNFDVAFQNDGTNTWTAAGQYGLKNLRSGVISIVSGCDGLGSGGVCTFHRFIKTGPPKEKFTVTYTMVHDGVPFGKTQKVKFQIS